MEPEAVIRAVFERVRAGDIAVADLYAADAVVESEPEPHIGRDAIRRYYARALAQKVQPEIEELFARPPWYAVVLRVMTPGGEVRVCDLFEVEGGAVRSLHVLRLVGG
jgi:hypothetical protein